MKPNEVKSVKPLVTSEAPTTPQATQQLMSSKPKSTSTLFSDADGDLVFTSSDRVEFRVHSWLLGLACSVFKDMLAFPQGPNSPAVNLSLKDKTLKEIDLSEDGETIEGMLRFIYPNVTAPRITSIDQLSTLVDAAMKYDCFPAQEALKTIMVQPEFLQTQPIRIYAIAKRYGLALDQNLLWKAVLSRPLVGEDGMFQARELEYISAKEYHVLLLAQRRRQARLNTIVARHEKSLNDLKKTNGCPTCGIRGCAWWPKLHAAIMEKINNNSPGPFIDWALVREVQSPNHGCYAAWENLHINQNLVVNLGKDLDSIQWAFAD